MAREKGEKASSKSNVHRRRWGKKGRVVRLWEAICYIGARHSETREVDAHSPGSCAHPAWEVTLAARTGGTHQESVNCQQR